jgi:hypothetical protein
MLLIDTMEISRSARVGPAGVALSVSPYQSNRCRRKSFEHNGIVR